MCNSLWPIFISCLMPSCSKDRLDEINPHSSVTAVRRRWESPLASAAYLGISAKKWVGISYAGLCVIWNELLCTYLRSSHKLVMHCSLLHDWTSVRWACHPTKEALPPVASVPDRLHHGKKRSYLHRNQKYIHETDSHLVSRNPCS